MNEIVYCRHGKVYINGSSLALSIPAEAVKLFNVTKGDEAKIMLLPYKGQLIIEFASAVPKPTELNKDDFIPNLGKDELKILKVLRNSLSKYILKPKISPIIFGKNTAITRTRVERAIKHLVKLGLVMHDTKAVYLIEKK